MLLFICYLFCQHFTFKFRIVKWREPYSQVSAVNGTRQTSTRKERPKILSCITPPTICQLHESTTDRSDISSILIPKKIQDYKGQLILTYKSTSTFVKLVIEVPTSYHVYTVRRTNINRYIKQIMGASCKDQKKAVAICLQRSPCVMIERHTPQRCLEDPQLNKDLPELCIAQMKAFLDCKRGMVDMTKRFRGNAPLSTGRYDQQYDNLCSGDFNPREEMNKLNLLNGNQKE